MGDTGRASNETDAKRDCNWTFFFFKNFVEEITDCYSTMFQLD